MGKIKAVILDLDGVLVAAKDWHYEALNQALALFGMAIPRNEHLARFDGLPTQKKLEMLSAERGLPVALHGFIGKLKQQRTLAIISSRCTPLFAHEFALSRLRRDGYKLAVCSNSVRRTVELALERTLLLPYFDFFLSNQDVTRAKPDPEMYNVAIARLGLRPDECLILEDNLHGVEAALASGGHLLRIGEVDDVNDGNIRARIREIEGQA